MEWYRNEIDIKWLFPQTLFAFNHLELVAPCCRRGNQGRPMNGVGEIAGWFIILL